jgi:simple sugar transport system permease protein
VQGALKDNHIRFLLVANVAILIVAALVSSGEFLDPFNLRSMAKQLPEIALLAMGVMLAMISGNGGIDLSVVSVANLSAVTAGLVSKAALSVNGNIPPERGVTFMLFFIVIALVVGILCGFINGLLIARVGFAPILATLGTQLTFTGLAVALSGGPAVSLGYVEPFVQIGSGYIFKWIPISFIIFIVASLALTWVLTRSPFGLRLYLMGSNAKAAHYTGINNSRILMFTYLTSAVLASIAGIIIASGASSAKWDYGTSYLLIAILIAVMGGINPDGGYGKITGLVLAAVALQLLQTTLSAIGANNFLKDFFWGLLLLLSIVFTNVGQVFNFSLGRRQMKGTS